MIIRFLFRLFVAWVAFTTVVSLVYTVAAFAYANIDPRTWTMADRATTGFLAVLFGCAAGVLSFINVKLEKA